jgi:hypothetical protein
MSIDANAASNSFRQQQAHPSVPPGITTATWRRLGRAAAYFAGGAFPGADCLLSARCGGRAADLR